jgi:hypothetical protein
LLVERETDGEGEIGRGRRKGGKMERKCSLKGKDDESDSGKRKGKGKGLESGKGK